MEWRLFTMELLFLIFFLQLKMIVCAIERHACESVESWSLISAPLSNIVTSSLRVIGTESSWHPCGKVALKLNPFNESMSLRTILAAFIKITAFS